MVTLNPYLIFERNAQEALTFYHGILGGDLDITVFNSIPAVAAMLTDPADGELVMHGVLNTPNGLSLMAADSGSMTTHQPATSGVTVAMIGGPEDHEYIAAAYEQLAVGATEVMPLSLAPWGDHFGQLTDRFGISWMFNIGSQ